MIAIILDGIIILLLAGTMFFAYHLSSHLRTFRNSKNDLGNLVQTLSNNIDKAQIAIRNLDEATHNNGRELQEIIDEARNLSDELQFMTEAGNNLANRLEKLSENKGKAAETERMRDLPSFEENADDPLLEGTDDEDLPFLIRDPEFEEEAMGQAAEPMEDFSKGENVQLKSRAEKELYQALQKKRKAR